MPLFSILDLNPSRWKPVLVAVIVLFTLSGAGFSFHDETVTWFWTEMPFIGVILILAAFGSAKIWVDLDRLDLKTKTETALREAGKSKDLKELLEIPHRQLIDRPQQASRKLLVAA